MTTYRQYEQQLAAALRTHYPAPEAASLARQTLQAASGLAAHELVLHAHATLPTATALILAGWQTRLLRAEPLQYITGEAIFYGLHFQVTPAVLIPRPETEELVRWILMEVPPVNAHILDIGTGSGCIAIALAHYQPEAHISAWDVSTEALRLARINASRNSVHVDFSQHDVFSAIPESGYHYPIIVSNPPYIPATETSSLHANVRDYEPHLALFVPDADPLLFYRRIAEIGLHLLAPGGTLYLEVHPPFVAQLQALLQSMGYANPVIRRDMQGRDRMLKANIGL